MASTLRARCARSNLFRTDLSILVTRSTSRCVAMNPATQQADSLMFADEAEDQAPTPVNDWPILLVDDEPDMHAITTLTLSELRWGGRSLAFSSAHSIAEAQQALAEQRFAAMIVDVQIDGEDAALLLTDYLRNTLDERATRVIVRSGDPSYSPDWLRDPQMDVAAFVDKSLGTVERMRSTVTEALIDFAKLDEANA